MANARDHDELVVGFIILLFLGFIVFRCETNHDKDKAQELTERIETSIKQHDIDKCTVQLDSLRDIIDDF